MSKTEQKVQLYTKDYKCYPITKVEFVEGLELDAGGGASKKYATFVVGHANSGHTAESVDYLCDGVADDIEINQAIANLPENGGKILILEGTYLLSNEIAINRNNVTLEGMGVGTILDRNLVSANVVGISQCSYCTVKNLTVMGGKYGVLLWGDITADNVAHCTISNVVAKNNGDRGIYIGQGGQGNIITNCIFKENTKGDIFVYSTGYLRIIGNWCSFNGESIASYGNDVLIAFNYCRGIITNGSALVENNMIF